MTGVTGNGPKILVVGRPGVGKSTAARAIARRLREAGVPVRGFVTDEVRQQGRRVGFVVASFSGRRALLAHVDLPGPPRVGKYGVDLAAFDDVALASLAAPSAREVVVVDELGKMELASPAFRDAVVGLFAGASPVVAAVHAFGHPLTDELKRRPESQVVNLTPANRDQVPAEVARRLLGPPARPGLSAGPETSG